MPRQPTELNCSTFGNACIDSMGWPTEFDACPLLPAVLALGAAWAWERDRREHGPMAAARAAACADKALSIALNDVAGQIDMISSAHWPGRRELRELYQASVEQVYRRHADQGGAAIAGARAKKPAGPKSATGKSRRKRRKAA